jgi:uncharacterized protein YndB with AHSA1/START domain
MSEETTLRIERIIDATPDAVFRAWTAREAMEEWYRDGDDFVARVVELDVREGGRYRIEFGPKGAPPFVEHGTYVAIEPPSRLVMTMTLEGVNDGWSDTTVTVVLEEEAGKTRLVLVHEGFPSVGARDGAAGGWPGFLDRLERVVRGTPG